MTTLQCPSCGADMSLDVCLAHAGLRQAYIDMLRQTLPMADLMFRYVNLFRPHKNKMRAERFARLLNDLLPCITAGAITHAGRDWAVPPELWRAGFEAMYAKAEANKITLPLTSHGYLFTILADLSDKAEAVLEKEREADRRHPRRTASAGLVQLSPAGIGHAIDPALAKIKATKADPMPESIKAKLKELKGTK